MPHPPRLIDHNPDTRFARPPLEAPRWRLAGHAVRAELDGGGGGGRGGGAEPRRILLGGDWAAVREFEDCHRREPSQLYGDLHPRIREADLSVVNLECPLGGDEPIPKDGPNFRCDPACAPAIAGAGFHVASLANNHIFDQGAAGVHSTLRACREAGLLTVGAGADLAHAMAPLRVEAGGYTIGLLALADTEEGMAGETIGGAGPVFNVHVLDRCRALAAESDVALVIVHGGKEYAPVPPPYWYEQLLAIASTGVDAVIGHHPHVPQGMTVARAARASDSVTRKAVPVVFSTGNFVFPPRRPTAVMAPWMSLGYLVELHLDNGRIAAVELVPYHITAPTGVRGLDDEQMPHFATFIEALSEPLHQPEQVEAWFDAAVDYFWTQEWCRRVEGLTAKLCRDDPAGLRHGRSHFRSRPHATLIDRVIHRKLTGAFATSPPELTARIEQWFGATWPTRALVQPSAACGQRNPP